MRLRNKIGSMVAVLAVAGAIGAAPANASSAPAFSIPSVESLGALCNTAKQPALKSACEQGVAIIQTCSAQKTTSAQVKCIVDAAKKFRTSKVTVPSGLNGLLGKFGGSLGGFNIGSLLNGIDLSKLLGGLAPRN